MPAPFRDRWAALAQLELLVLVATHGRTRLADERTQGRAAAASRLQYIIVYDSAVLHFETRLRTVLSAHANRITTVDDCAYRGLEAIF